MGWMFAAGSCWPFKLKFKNQIKNTEHQQTGNGNWFEYYFMIITDRHEINSQKHDNRNSHNFIAKFNFREVGEYVPFTLLHLPKYKFYVIHKLTKCRILSNPINWSGYKYTTHTHTYVNILFTQTTYQVIPFQDISWQILSISYSNFSLACESGFQ